MAFDPNLYAIQIQLTMDSSEAFSAINELEDAVGGIESRLSSALASTLDQITTNATEMTTELGATTTLVDEIGSSMTDQIDQFGETAEKQVEFNELLEESKITEEEIRDILEEVQELREMDAMIQEGIIDMQLARNSGTAMHRDMISDVVTRMEAAGASQEQINEFIRQSGVYTQDWGDDVNDLLDSVNELTLTFQRTIGSLAAATQETERFVTANYRAYGAQLDLLENSRQLAAEYNLFTGEAVEAYDALMKIRIPHEMLEEYVGLVGQSSRITGVAVGTLTEYIRTHRSASLTYEQSSAAIGVLSAAQEKLGLTVEEVNKILGLQSEKLSYLSNLLGNEVPEQMNVALAGFASLIKETGTSEKGLADLNRMLMATGEEAYQLQSIFGPGFDGTIEGRFDTIMEATQRFAGSLNDLRDENGKITDSLAEATIMRHAEALGLSTEMVNTLSVAMMEAEKNGTDLNVAFADYEKQLKEGIERSQQMADAQNSLYAAYSELTTAIGAVVAPFIIFIAQGLTPLIGAIADVISWIADAIQMFQSWWTALEETLPFLSYVRQGVQMLVAGAILLGVVITPLIGIIGSLGSALISFGGTLFSTGGLFTAFTARIGSGLATMGASVSSFMGSLGQGLARMAAGLQRAALPLLAIGAALALAGVGAWLLADATMALAAGGADAAIALAGMTAALLVLGAGLALIGSLVQGPVAAGVLVLSVALLAAGAAAWMMGQGIAAASEGLIAMMGVVTFEAAMNLNLFAAGVMALGIAGIASSAGIVVLAGALWLLGGRAVKAGQGMMMIAMSMKTIEDIKIPDIRADITSFVSALTDGVDEMADASASLGSIKSDIDGFVNVLTVAALRIQIASVPMAAAGDNIREFALALKEFENIEIPDLDDQLRDLAVEVYQAAVLLYAGSVLTQSAIVGLIVAGGMMSIASVSIIGGATGMAFAATFLLSSAALLGIAAGHFDDFYDAAARVSGLDFGELRQSIIELGAGTRDVVEYADRMGGAANAFNEISIGDFSLDQDIINVASSLADAIEQLVEPMEQLEQQVDEIVEQVDRLAESEARVRQISQDVTDIASIRNDIGNAKPNEMRTVERVNEVINAIVDKDGNNDEMLAVLNKILAALEKKDEDKEEGFFGVGEKAPNEGKKFKEAGINL